MSSPTDPAQAALIRLMRARGASRAGVARACGCSPQLVSRWIQGTRRIQDEWFPRLAAYFGVSEQLMRYGQATDTDALAAITAGILAGLEDHDVVTSSLPAEQIGHLVAWAFEHYVAHGQTPDEEVFSRILKLLGAVDDAPGELAPRKSG